MAEYKRPANEQDFKENFKQKKPLMNDTQAHYESSRCLFCYDAPCMDACPTGIDIPLFIKQIQTGNTDGAAKTIYDSNWMGNACGTICPTGVLCEGACVYNNQDVAPLLIGRLQNYATHSVIESGKQLYYPGDENGKKVAIIGAGPAGIACACELRTLGYEVDIYEAKSQPSGLTVHGIAPYKISNEEVIAEMDYLQNQLGYNIIYNHPISTKDQLSELESNYSAIFIGVGLGVTASLNMTGENLTGVRGAVEFIEELRMNHSDIKIADRVVVIGGGNTAMDAASGSARLGAEEVTLAYRRDKNGMGAYGFEYDLAIGAGVNGLFNAAPLEIIGSDKVEGVRFIKTELSNGKLTNIEGSEFTIACDMVIKATGQAKQGSFLSLIEGLDVDDRTRIVVNAETNQTTNEMYFAGGDAINGGAEVVNGAYDGKLAANGIHEWLTQN
ncbi:MAG: dihydropyrimidine dehydrogenase (NAD+) subunit PreT [Flavobacteriaceae bacterium]|jgi:dihydropyrimidine dehydrogenase (NAD+) subunit PreT